MIETARTWLLLKRLRSGVGSPPRELRRLQDRSLCAAVGHAYENVPFYRKHWDEQGFEAGSVRGIQDLERIPITPSPKVRQAVNHGDLLALNVDQAECSSLYTTGSSGTPLRILRHRGEERLWRAGGLRILFEHGYRWHHKKVQFEAHPDTPHILQRFGISRTTWVSTELSCEEQRDRFLKTGADWMIGTPTVLRRLASILAAVGDRFKRPHTILCPGELLDPETRGAIERVFGITPVSVYALTECGYVAWQCERHESFHVNANTHLVEVLRDGKAAHPGELGKIVVTDLHNRTMPLLRYDTGDLAVAATAMCPCGRQLEQLASIEGRMLASVVFKDGRILTHRRIVEHLAAVVSLDEYCLYQETVNRFRFKLFDTGMPKVETKGRNELRRHSTDAILGHLRKILGEVEISIEIVKSVPEHGVKTSPVFSAVSNAMGRDQGLPTSRSEGKPRATILPMHDRKGSS
jgi:phenylacetate-CoA ligase